MTKRISILIIIVAIIIIGVLIYTSQKPGEEKEVVKIGFIGPLSGDLASWGEREQKGLELALEEINNSGGVNGRPIKLIYEDTRCEPQAAATGAQKLIEIDKVSALIGETCSSATLAAIPIAERNKIVQITPVSGNDSISQAGDYIFRNFIANRQYAEVAAQVVKEKFNKNKIAILYLNNDYGADVKEIFKKNFEGEIVLDEGYNDDVKDFRTLLAKVKAVEPDLIYLSGYYPDGALILKQAKEMGIDNIPFLGSGDAYDDPKLIEVAGEATEDFVFLSVPITAGPEGENFVKKFKEKYNSDPLVFSDFAYDTLKILALVMQKGIDSETIKNELYKIDYNGASNRIRFDENGDIIEPVVVLKVVKNGEIVLYE